VMTDSIDLEIELRWRPQVNGFDVALHRSDPRNEEEDRLVVDQPLRLDVEHLRTLVVDVEAYSRLLSETLFGMPDVADFFDKARTVADASDVPLRLRLLVDPKAPAQFHALRWETLRDPRTGHRIATMRNVLFSRYLSSARWRPLVPAWPGHELRALIAVANPDGLDAYAPGGTPLAPIDADGELDRARSALSDLQVTVLASRGEATLENIIDVLEKGPFDILYLICHGALVSDRPVVYLEKPDGSVGPADARTLVERLEHLDQRPAVVVLSAPQGGGIGDEASSRDEGGLAILGPRLAEAGIAAIVAMQANVTMGSITTFMPTFFVELRRDGWVDRAMAVARSAIQDRADWWAPVLFMRLKSGRISEFTAFSSRLVLQP
jgi:CHAT domain